VQQNDDVASKKEGRLSIKKGNRVWGKKKERGVPPQAGAKVSGCSGVGKVQRDFEHRENRENRKRKRQAETHERGESGLRDRGSLKKT